MLLAGTNARQAMSHGIEAKRAEATSCYSKHDITVKHPMYICPNLLPDKLATAFYSLHLV